jgi:hypothetical protein
MMEGKPKAAEQAPKSRRMAWIIVAVVVAVMVVGGGAAYYWPQQLNIEVTKVNFGKASENPQSSTPVDQGGVSGSASFSFAADATGTYEMYFENNIDLGLDDKSVALSYSINGQSTSQTFDVPAQHMSTVSVGLNKGDTLSGQFTIVGGSYNDLNFWITGSTCTATVPVTFVLVNRGLTGGYAMVVIQSNGQTLWSNKYYVSAGQQSPESTSLVLPTCSTPQLTVVVLSQQKG